MTTTPECRAMGERLTREQLGRSIKACPPSDMRTALQMARASLDLQERNTWLLARWEELYDVLALTGPVRHPVDATEQVRIQRDDLTVAERRARRWEAAARRWWNDRQNYAAALRAQRECLEQHCHAEAVYLVERDSALADLSTARRELGEANKRIESLENTLRDLSCDGCEYGDDCPTFGSRHGKCIACKCREALAYAAKGAER